MSENDGKRIKVTVSFYYDPDLGPGGGYTEHDGYGNFIPLCKTVEQAAAFDFHNFQEGQFSMTEYMEFGISDDADITVEVVREVPDQFGIGPATEEILYTVPKRYDVYEASEVEYYNEFGGNDAQH